MECRRRGRELGFGDALALLESFRSGMNATQTVQIIVMESFPAEIDAQVKQFRICVVGLFQLT
jgi:hypothetical protein